MKYRVIETNGHYDKNNMENVTYLPQYKRFFIWHFFKHYSMYNIHYKFVIVGFSLYKDAMNYIFVKRSEKQKTWYKIHKYNKMWGVKK